MVADDHIEKQEGAEELKSEHREGNNAEKLGSRSAVLQHYSVSRGTT